MELTARDTEILRVVYRHRFLRSPQIAALLGASTQPILRRLQKLFHHGYLERPTCQLDYFQKGGSRSMVYGLGSRGAAYLHRLGHPLPACGKEVGRLFLDHALMVSEIMVSLELACRAAPGLQLLRETDLIGSCNNGGISHAFRWRVELPSTGEVGVVPDAMFALRVEAEEVLVCLEADRGTMPVQSSNPHRSSLSKKIAAYETSWRAGIFRERFGSRRVRILTVTTSEERLQNFESCAAKLRAGLFQSQTLNQLLASPLHTITSLAGAGSRAAPV